MKRKISTTTDEATEFYISQLKEIYENNLKENASVAQLLREGLSALYFIRFSSLQPTDQSYLKVHQAMRRYCKEHGGIIQK